MHDGPQRVSRRDRGRLGRTKAVERARVLVAVFEKEPTRAFAVAELAARSGYPPQSCAVAVEALRAVGFAERLPGGAPGGRALWRRSTRGPKSESIDDLDRELTVIEAAQLASRSTKTIRGRMDRRTLAFWVERHTRYTTPKALMNAGLLPGGRPKSAKARGVNELVRYLSLRPATRVATSYLARQTGLSRQDCETALGVLVARKLVRREIDTSYDNTVWEWTGTPHPNAPPPETPRPRPSPSPARRPLIEQNDG